MKTQLPTIVRTLVACLFAASANLHAAAIFTPNNMPEGWVGEVDVSGFDFTDGLQKIFKGDFIKGEWSGNLSSFPVDMDGTVLLDAANWSSVDNLDSQSWDSGRKIVTMKSDGTKIPFRFLSLSFTQAKDIDGTTKDAKSQAASVIGPNIINYIRGDATNEKPSGTNLYRPRQHKLGDIIHSRPLFIDDATDPRVYVGGNDGMLHSFDADNGDEVFAYVPSFFISPVATTSFSNIKALTVDPIVHNYFVDGSPNAATVSLSGGITKVLVGGVGAGGKGLYALNISTPPTGTEDQIAAKVMWEITPTTINNVATTSTTGYPDLGHTYGIPIIGKASDGTWVAIVGNGYNNQGSNHAVLYVINLADGSRKAAITASAGVTGVSNSNPNGLSSPTAVDTDHDGKIDYVYAGDINGNLWKFNLTSTTAASWTATKLYTTNPAQAITGRPVVSLHPLGGYMVNFTTGREFTSTDGTDATTVYYAWGIRDNATTIADANIVSQTLTAKTWTATGGFNYAVRVSSSNAVDYAATTPKQGWKMALPAGERAIGDGGLVTNMRYVFATTNPSVAHAAVSGVAQPQGDNWLNEVDFTTGGGGTAPVFDLDANLALNDGDRVRDSGGTAAQAGSTGIPVSKFIVSGIMSQPIVARLDKLSETYFNTNPDFITSAATSTPGQGVSDGHFDFDVYYTCTGGTKFSCGKNTHVHQYDDKYDVTGVDMQNASLAAENLVNAIPLTTTRFKILVANQALSPALRLQIGTSSTDPWTPVYNILTPTASSPPPTLGTGTVLGTNTAFSSALTVYQRSTLLNLRVNMPLYTFLQLDWQHGEATCTPATNAYCMVGLVPTATGCVHGNDTGYDPSTITTLEPYGGLWSNAALTIQIIKETTPDSAITLASPNKAGMGYRLKGDATSITNLLAQYTIFWHHPNGKCYGQSGWGNTATIAYADTADKATASTIAPGSDDPKGGSFGTSGSTTGTGTGSVSGPTSTITYYFADGSSVTQTTTQNSDGSISVTRHYNDGTVDIFVIPPNSGGKQSDTRAKTGRVSWREMIRP